MSKKVLRRVVAGAGSVALAGGMVATVGAGLAAAAPIASPQSWGSHGVAFTRTIDKTSPNVGDTVRVTTTTATSGVDTAYIYRIQDFHPACLTYVGNSARVDGTVENAANVEVNADTNGLGYALLKNDSPGWYIGLNKSRSFSFDYTVGPGCAGGTDLMTTLTAKYYSVAKAWSGTDALANKGPTLSVAKVASTTALAAVQNVQVRQASTLSATVTGGRSGDPVDFYDAGTKIGSGVLDGSGKASFQWTPTVKGAHSLQAKFPDTGYATGSQSAVQNVNATQANVNSTVAVGAVAGAQVGKASTLAATVTPAGAGGTVTFKDGAATIASAPVGADGKASYNWTPATAGDHAITAEFSGRDGVNASTGGPVTVAVADQPAESTPSTTTLNGLSGAQVGKATTVSAKVSPANAGGTVTFKDGDTVIGTGQVGADGTASTNWTPATSGQRTLTAEFSGNGTVTSSSDQVSVSVAPGTGGGTPGTPGTGGGTGSLSNLLGGFGSSK
ncbi:Ig-like domain-containing protein [Speluncibacter jeojiensis]|uniref:Ig-like domain-containing protein n=1 Tax=Speluncibacter jeojiensis TaxID=2710754 RepID=A0A9X4M0J9_9ACTN|nr:Ig-like domain-containing protein [Corynebacteriales bacterium D3-21]